MKSTRAIDELIDSVREGVALDIYGIFEGEEKKRLLGETMIATIVTGLILEYLKGFLRPKEVGEERSRSLGSLVGAAKNEKLPDQTSLKGQLSSTLAQLKSATASEKALALSSFALDLVDAGIPSATAKTLAQVISDAVASQLS